MLETVIGILAMLAMMIVVGAAKSPAVKPKSKDKPDRPAVPPATVPKVPVVPPVGAGHNALIQRIFGDKGVVSLTTEEAMPILAEYANLNCRDAKSYTWDSIKSLAILIANAGGNTEPITLCTVQETQGLAPLAGHRRIECIKAIANPTPEQSVVLKKTANPTSDTFVWQFAYAGIRQYRDLREAIRNTHLAAKGLDAASQNKAFEEHMEDYPQHTESDVYNAAGGASKKGYVQGRFKAWRCSQALSPVDRRYWKQYCAGKLTVGSGSAVEKASGMLNPAATKFYDHNATQEARETAAREVLELRIENGKPLSPRIMSEKAIHALLETYRLAGVDRKIFSAICIVAGYSPLVDPAILLAKDKDHASYYGASVDATLASQFTIKGAAAAAAADATDSIPTE